MLENIGQIVILINLFHVLYSTNILYAELLTLALFKQNPAYHIKNFTPKCFHELFCNKNNRN